MLSYCKFYFSFQSPDIFINFVSLYSHNVLFKPIPGAPPSLLLLNEFDEVLEKVDISDFSREECNNFLLRKGFYKKSNSQDEVPEQFLTGPYLPREDL